MSAVEEARAAVEQEVTEFGVLRDLMEAAPGTKGGKIIPTDVWISQLSVVLALCHQSNMKLILAIEELEAK